MPTATATATATASKMDVTMNDNASTSDDPTPQPQAHQHTRLPTTDMQLELISDIGPELVQRWCESGACLPSLSSPSPSPSPSSPLPSSSSSRGVGNTLSPSPYPTPTSKPFFIIPALFRALLSAVLRAASYDEADDFMRSYRRLLPYAKRGSPGSVLGFSAVGKSKSKPGKSARGGGVRARAGAGVGVGLGSGTEASEVWYDIFHSAARGDALVPEGPALTFYNYAGAGAGDSSEYGYATVDNRVEGLIPCESDIQRDLIDVRAYARSLVIRHAFTHAISSLHQHHHHHHHDDDRTEWIDECQQAYGMRFLSPFTTTLPKCMDVLPRHSCLALHAFYNAVYHQRHMTNSNVVKKEFLTRLMSSVFSLAVEKPQNVLPFLTDVVDEPLRLSVTRRCLAQRFAVVDRHPQAPLSWEEVCEVVVNVRETPVPGRPNKALPGLLAVLVATWAKTCMSEGGGGGDRLGNRTEVERLALSVNIRALGEVRRRKWTAFNAPEQDVVALELALHQFVLTAIL